MHRITTCESPRTAASSPTAFARSGSGTATVRGADRPRPRYTACDPVTVIVCAEWGGCETGLVSPLGAFNVLELHLSPSSHARDGGTQRRAQASHARWIRPNENTLQVADQVIARSAAGGPGNPNVPCPQTCSRVEQLAHFEPALAPSGRMRSILGHCLPPLASPPVCYPGL